MRAVGLFTHGGPEVLQLVELPDVHAGPGQVRIRVHAATVNPTDIGVRNALSGLGFDPVTTIADSDRWRPWRSYALMHLWNTLMPAVEPAVEPAAEKEN